MTAKGDRHTAHIKENKTRNSFEKGAFIDERDNFRCKDKYFCSNLVHRIIFFCIFAPLKVTKMLLSFIIPAYNVEKYIVACLDSCLAQGIDDMEVIVVDDGSTDRTPALLDEYAQQHRNVKIVRQENQGQSVARNRAIEMAKGDYIYMVDADDKMMDNYVLPFDIMRSGKYDIIGLQVMYQLEDGTRRPWSHQMEHWPFDQEYATGAEFVRTHNIEGLVYGYLFKRSLFTEHPELRFTPGIYHQDEELIFKLFTLAGPVVYKRGYAYLYFEHSGSSINTRTEARKRKLMDDTMTIINDLIRWRDEHELHDVMRYKLSYLSMDVLRVLVRKQHDVDYAMQCIEKLRQLGLYPLPWINECKYLGVKFLTCSKTLVKWWIEHPQFSKKVGF